MKELVAIAGNIAARLIERRQTIAVAESSTGGLISAALLAVPGASAYFLGSAVVYTRDARRILMDIPDEAMKGIRSASEVYAKLLASQIRQRFSCDWGLSETGATGPTGNRYGDAAGHHAWRSQVSSSPRSPLKPAAPTASPTCMCLQRPRWICCCKAVALNLLDALSRSRGGFARHCGQCRLGDPSLRGAKRRSNPLSPLLWLWIASRSLSSGAHSRDPLARNDGCASLPTSHFKQPAVYRHGFAISPRLFARGLPEFRVL
jgi:nicotinamide-nucleotide amidase